MTSYTITTETEADAIDIAKRRAADDGLRVLRVGRSYRGTLTGTWVVYLRVEVATWVVYLRVEVAR